MTKKTPHISVLGCGYWGKNLVRNFYTLGALHSVCESNEDNSKLAGELAPKAKLYSCYDDILKSNDVKAVAIATPAETHFELTKKALLSGKDVLVEKPLALHAEEGCKLHKLAKQEGRILMVGHLLEYHPAVLKLRRLISSGTLGKINYIYSNRLNFGKIRTEENALWSFAPHDIAVIIRLIGELPTEVSANGGSYITAGLSDVTMSCLKFASGTNAHIFVSWLNPFKEQKLVVVGSRKMAVFNDVSKTEKLLLYNQHVEIKDKQPQLLKESPEVIALPESEPLKKECEEFIACIESRQEPLTSSRSGVDVLKVLESCQQSLSNNGTPVILDETTTSSIC